MWRWIFIALVALGAWRFWSIDLALGWGPMSDTAVLDPISISQGLVEIAGTDGWRWRNSLTRSDTGDGACELVWVEDLRVN